MSAAAVPPDEAARLRALAELDIVGSPPEAEFDALVAAAAAVCGVPISLISLVAEDQQWFKASIGLDDLTATPREHSVCAHTLFAPDLLEICDTLEDPRFSDNPLVTGEPRMRFYAGAPLRLADGHHVGTLCVIDRIPRQLTQHQRQVLTHLAEVVVHALENRRALRTERQRLSNILDGTQAGTWEHNLQTQAVRFNERWAAIIGYTLADLQPITMQTWLNLVHPEDQARCEAALAEHLHGTRELYECEIRLRHRHGHWAWVHSRGQVMTRTPDGQPEWMFGTHLDITARKQQEQALLDSRSTLDRTAHLAGIGGFEIDKHSQRVKWSDECCRIHGMPVGTQPTLNEALDYFPEDQKPTVRESLQMCLNAGIPFELEMPLIPADQQPRWVRLMGSMDNGFGDGQRMVGAMQDITERVQQRIAIERVRDRLKLATDSGHFGIWEYDAQTRKVTWNDWMFRLYNVPLDTPVDTELWFKHVHPDDRERVSKAMARATQLGEPINGEMRVNWADGSTHYLASAARSELDAEGRLVRMVGVNWDVSELRHLARELSNQHELLKVTLQSIGDAVITTDAAGLVSWLNPTAERLTGWSSTQAELRQLNEVFDVLDERNRATTPDLVAQCLDQGHKPMTEIPVLLRSRSGQEYGIEESASPILDDNGQVRGIVVVFRDVTEKRRLSSEMRYRASHDTLTGLYNREEFEIRLRQLLEQTHKRGGAHALMYIDLDQFKLVNDACGHTVGDELLQNAAQLLRECVRATDTLARLGGDEFAVILENCPIEHSQRVAQSICERMDDFRFVHEGRRFRIGTSIGLVPVDQRWSSTGAILQAADTSCYAAKEAGRNRVHIWYDADLAMRARHGQMEWAGRIEHALDEGRFVLFAQRIEPCQPGKHGLHAEVLIRMIDSHSSLISPTIFLPAAERFGLCSRIDRWVLRRTLDVLKQLPDIRQVELLCVNLSGQSIGDRAFHRQTLDTLSEVSPDILRHLCLEVTETAAITNLADAAAFIQEVRSLGVRIALDDFGAGASSFGYLKNLPVDYLKIDGQFVKDIIEDPLDEAAVRCFTEVARVIGVKTVAEFVDRPEVLARIREIGVDYAQGFLLHQPEALENLLMGSLEELRAKRVNS